MDDVGQVDDYFGESREAFQAANLEQLKEVDLPKAMGDKKWFFSPMLEVERIEINGLRDELKKEKYYEFAKLYIIARAKDKNAVRLFKGKDVVVRAMIKLGIWPTGEIERIFDEVSKIDGAVYQAGQNDDLTGNSEATDSSTTSPI